MAFDAGTIMARMALDAKGFTAGIGAIQKDTRSMMGTLMGFNTLIRGTLVGSLGFAAIKMIETGGRMLSMERAFDRMAASVGKNGDEIIAQAKGIESSLSSEQIMRAANMMTSLGVSIDKLPRLLEIAKSSAKAFGTDTLTQFEALATGVATGNQKMLRTAGIIVDTDEVLIRYSASIGKFVSQLTDAERRTAILEQVLGNAGDVMLEQFGPGADTAADGISRASAAVKDLTAEFGALIAQKQGVADFFATSIEGWVGYVKSIRQNGFMLALPGLSKPIWFGAQPGGGATSGGAISIGGSVGQRVSAPTTSTSTMARQMGGGGLPGTFGPRGQGPEPDKWEAAILRSWTLLNRPQDLEDNLSKPLTNIGLQTMEVTSGFSQINDQIHVTEGLAMSLGDSFAAGFQTMIENSDRAGRVFAATMLDSIGNVASGMGQFFVQTGIGLKGLLGLNPFLTIIAGYALMAISGTLRGIGGKQTPAIAGSPISERSLRERETVQGTTQFVIQGTSGGNKEWLRWLIEQLRITQRNQKVDIVFTG